MRKQTITGNQASRIVWDNLEEWVRMKVQEFIQSLLEEKVFSYLKAPILRVSLPDAPAPASSVLEQVYYPSAKAITSAIKQILVIG